MEFLANQIQSGVFLVHVASLLQVAAYAMKDQIALRVFAFAGSILYILYYFIVPEIPLWDAIAWTVVLTLVNIFVTIQLLLERSTFGMSAEEKLLYKYFSTMNPGEFRRLLKISNWIELQEDEVIISEDETNEMLYFLIEGEAQVRKGERDQITIGPESFLGELTFLSAERATASVVLRAGSRAVSWNHTEVAQLERRYPAIRIAIREALNVDLTRKIINW